MEEMTNLQNLVQGLMRSSKTSPEATVGWYGTRLESLGFTREQGWNGMYLRDSTIVTSHSGFARNVGIMKSVLWIRF